MSKKRVLVLCLDAYDAKIGDELMAQGLLPGLSRLKAQSARFDLEHGPEGKSRYTGLTWEHFSSGQRPETSGKWSVITFDPKTFTAMQDHATLKPFFADVDAKCVVFDPPYFNLRAAENAVGVVGWSGHDTGCNPYSAPAGLMDEITAKFGAPPHVLELNTMVYPSVEKTKAMADLLVDTVKQRTDAAEWLLAECAPDWDVAVVGYGEPHDAIELFTHGVVKGHHLEHLPSAPVAREGLIAVYKALSENIERLMDRFPDADIVAFTMHGMGLNDTDLPTMLLLPELMYRVAFERPLFDSRDDWRNAPVSPVLREDENWNDAVIGAMRHARPDPSTTLQARATRKALRIASKLTGGAVKTDDNGRDFSGEADVEGPQEKSFAVDWMPSVQYSRYWADMDAIGVPAYFDGRVRINLKGREKYGRVPVEQYKATLDKIETILRECVDTKTGLPIIKEITRPGENDPMSLDETQADIKILWNGSPVGFRHPKYGDIGPGPVRRAGGHSGGYGAMFIRADGVQPGSYGVRSSFDVAPTIVDLLGAHRPNRMDGESVFRKTASNDGVELRIEAAE